MVLGQALVLAAIGMAIGIAVAAGVAVLVQREFFGVQPIDPLTWIGVTIVLVGSVAAACWWPARRASRVDPAIVLRHN